MKTSHNKLEINPLLITVKTQVNNYWFYTKNKKKLFNTLKSETKTHVEQLDSLSNIITNQASSSYDFTNIKPEGNLHSNQSICSSLLNCNIKELALHDRLFQTKKAFPDGWPVWWLWRKHLHFGIIQESHNGGLCFLSSIWV